jgi:hypothetical protein
MPLPWCSVSEGGLIGIIQTGCSLRKAGHTELRESKILHQGKTKVILNHSLSFRPRRYAPVADILKGVSLKATDHVCTNT